MTTGTPQRSVLLIGRSQRVLDDTAAGLRDLGYTAQATNDFFSDITGRFDVTHIDLVTLGGAVPPARKAELREQIGAINPRVIFLEGLAGIPGLIISQVQGAFTAGRQDPAHAPAYLPGDRSIRLTLADPAAVKVTAWWRTSAVPDPGSDSLVLLDGRLAGGDHTIPVPGHIPPLAATPGGPRPAAWFATVQIDAAIYAFGITVGNNKSQADPGTGPGGYTPTAPGRVIRSADTAVTVWAIPPRVSGGHTVVMHLKDDELTSALSSSLGEDLLAAAYARVSTALSLARMLTPLGNYLIARPAARAAARKITEETEVPLDAAVVIGITAKDLHLWRADPMLNQVGEHIGEVPLSRIAAITVTAGRSWQPMTITMDGGEHIELEGRGAAHAVANVFNEYRRG
jgi:hypothetical protein